MNGNASSEKDFAEEHIQFRDGVQTMKAETERNKENIHSMHFKYQQNSFYANFISKYMCVNKWS